MYVINEVQILLNSFSWYNSQIIESVFFLTVVFFHLQPITDQINEPLYHIPLPFIFSND
jgi:hypothetical protein